MGAAPNGGRGCFISAIGIGGGRAIYTGSEEGLVYVSPDAQTSDNPTWTKVGNSLPGRPVGSIAVDRSNYRIAYVAFEGFNAGTSGQPGHVFKTTDGGNKWKNISGNLPDSPVNSLVLDPSYPDTLYAGTDVGAFVTYDGGQTWSQLGTGFPTVAIWQLDFDPSQAGVRTLAAGTHGRSAWTLDDARSVPAFDLSKVDGGTPIGPSKTMTYTLTLKNIGNGAATGVTITDPVPANTTSPVAQDGGTVANGKVTWSGLTVPAQGSVAVHFTVSVASALGKKIKSIVNDGVVVTSDRGRRDDGLAVRDSARPAVCGEARSGDADQRRQGADRCRLPRNGVESRLQRRHVCDVVVRFGCRVHRQLPRLELHDAVGLQHHADGHLRQFD